MPPEQSKLAAAPAKIVIRLGDRVLKGYTEHEKWLQGWDASDGSSPPVRLLESEHEQVVSLEDVKAVFFVHSFDGTTNKDLRFHDNLDHAACLWVRVIFHDKEVIEGLIPNSGDYFLKESFFLTPSDPEGNNWLIYLRKSQLRDFHVLGLRSGKAI